MKVLLFGGTGFVGRNLTRELMEHEYEIYVVSRNPQKIPSKGAKKVRFLEWDSSKPLARIENLKEMDAVINLAGESIGSRRWSNSVKQEIFRSRVETTRAIVTAINEGSFNPKVLINASAVGYYGPRKDEEITEEEGAGKDFLAEVCQVWENEAYKVKGDKTRVAMLRIGVVLGNEGALNRMVMPYKFFFGGPLGNGEQWLSWIHIQDLVRLVRFAIEHEELNGPINATAPESIKMKDFGEILGRVMNRPSWFPIPEFLLKIALGQMSEMLLHGQRVVPKKLVDAGFEFQFEHLQSALESILRAEYD